MFGAFSNDESVFSEGTTPSHLATDWYSNSEFTTPFFDEFDFSSTQQQSTTSSARISPYSTEYRVPDESEFSISHSKLLFGEPGSARKRKEATPEETVKEEAKLRRRRRKTVFEGLQRQVSEMLSAKLLVEVGTYATLLSAPQAEDALVRKAIVKTFLHYRISDVVQLSKWRDLLDDSFVLDLPDTSIFRAVAVRSTPYGGSGYGYGGYGYGGGVSAGGKKRLIGINSIVQDIASITGFLEMINSRALEKHNSVIMSGTEKGEEPPTPPAPITLSCRVKASDIVVDGPRLMCHWVTSTCGLSEYAGYESKECAVDGMLKCSFNDRHKLVSMELTFDVLSFARKLNRLGFGNNQPTSGRPSPSSVQSSSTPNSSKGFHAKSTASSRASSRGSRDLDTLLPPLRVAIPLAMRHSMANSQLANNNNGNNHHNTTNSNNSNFLANTDLNELMQNNLMSSSSGTTGVGEVDPSSPPTPNFDAILKYLPNSSSYEPYLHGQSQPGNTDFSSTSSVAAAMQAMGITLPPTNPTTAATPSSTPMIPNQYHGPPPSSGGSGPTSLPPSYHMQSFPPLPDQLQHANWANNMQPPPINTLTPSSSLPNPPLSQMSYSNHSMMSTPGPPPQFHPSQPPPMNNELLGLFHSYPPPLPSQPINTSASPMHLPQQPLPPASQTTPHSNSSVPDMANIQKIMTQNGGLIPMPLLNSMVNSLGLNNGLGSLLGNHNPHAPFPDQNINFSANQAPPAHGHFPMQTQHSQPPSILHSQPSQLQSHFATQTTPTARADTPQNPNRNC